jgi:hypothetical protein
VSKQHPQRDDDESEVKFEHPALRAAEARDRFERGARIAVAWNKKKHLDCTDWRTRGEMVEGKEHCFLASAKGGHDLPEKEWAKS